MSYPVMDFYRCGFRRCVLLTAPYFLYVCKRSQVLQNTNMSMFGTLQQTINYIILANYALEIVY